MTGPVVQSPSPPRARRASAADTARFAAEVGLPFVAAGAIARRRRVMGLLERTQADARIVATVARLRDRYGDAPLTLALPGRTLAVVLSPQDVDAVLRTDAGSYTAATVEKRAALGPFQPHGVLVSRTPLRERRRAVNEAALDTDRDLHRLATPMLHTIEEEANGLLRRARAEGGLSAAEFTRCWWRLVRRLVLGDAARDDDTLTDQLWRLRSDGNWAYAHPVRHRLRDRFTERLHGYVERAPAGTLAGALGEIAEPAAVDPQGQIPHWLFAFDAAGMVTARTLAVLATHPEQRTRARSDIAAAGLGSPAPLEYLRGCVLDTTRLWPTTPAILRDSTADTTWSDERGSYPIPSGTGFVVLAPAFHRDRETLPFADRFAPEIWLDGRADRYPALVPFSVGPAGCPGRNLVLFVTSTLLAHLLAGAEFTLTSRLTPDPARPLPATLNNFGLQFAVRSPAG